MHRSRRLGAVLGLLLAALSSRAISDDWPGPRVRNVFSDDGRHFVRISPGESVGDSVGFQGAKKGAYARAEFYARHADRSYALVADVTLKNPVAPVDALVSNAGYLITFDNWHNAGYGHVVAIYEPRGSVIATYELERLYPEKLLAQVSRSVSSRSWRCSAFGFVDANQTAVYVGERLGGVFVFQVAAAKFEYQPGEASCQ